MAVNAEQLARLHIGSQWVDALNETFERFEINTHRKQAAFIGQCGHECGNFKILEENLNYRAATLMKLWPKRFPTQEVANAYEKNPRRIANMVYSGRMGNGPAESGEGWKYRGRGLKQLTGKDNYARCGRDLNIDIVNNPDLLLEPIFAARSAGWFWKSNNLASFADSGDLEGMTKKINGGLIGYAERKAKYDKILNAINI